MTRAPADAEGRTPRSGIDELVDVSEAVVQRLLQSARAHLGLDVAFIGEVVRGDRVFRFVDTAPGRELIQPGGRDPLEESYCGQVLDGRLPEFLLDPATHPVSARMSVTHELPVGSHLSVPITFSDGRVYGTFCCFSTEVHPSLDESDLRGMRMLADLAGEYLEVLDERARRRAERRAHIEAVIAQRSFTMAFQPMWDLHTGAMVAVEALARFANTEHGPDWFFNEAAAVGLGPELELLAAGLALDALPQIPAPVRLNINLSADTLYTEEFSTAFCGAPDDRVVVEVTEHMAISDYAQLREASERLTARGIWLAIDDVGMGFSGLNHILECQPEELKLDAKVVRGVDTDRVRQALVRSLCSFGYEAGFVVVAEGIETEAELNMLRRLGASYGQGYHLGRPDQLDRVLALRLGDRRHNEHL